MTNVMFYTSSLRDKTPDGNTEFRSLLILILINKSIIQPFNRL